MKFETLRWPEGTLRGLQQVVGQLVLPGANFATAAELMARINAAELVPEKEETPEKKEEADENDQP